MTSSTSSTSTAKVSTPVLAKLMSALPYELKCEIVKNFRRWSDIAPLVASTDENVRQLAYDSVEVIDHDPTYPKKIVFAKLVPFKRLRQVDHPVMYDYLDRNTDGDFIPPPIPTTMSLSSVEVAYAPEDWLRDNDIGSNRVAASTWMGQVVLDGAAGSCYFDSLLQPSMFDYYATTMPQRFPSLTTVEVNHLGVSYYDEAEDRTHPDLYHVLNEMLTLPQVHTLTLRCRKYVDSARQTPVTTVVDNAPNIQHYRLIFEPTDPKDISQLLFELQGWVYDEDGGHRRLDHVKTFDWPIALDHIEVLDWFPHVKSFNICMWNIDGSYRQQLELLEAIPADIHLRLLLRPDVDYDELPPVPPLERGNCEWAYLW